MEKMDTPERFRPARPSSSKWSCWESGSFRWRVVARGRPHLCFPMAKKLLILHGYFDGAASFTGLRDKNECVDLSESFDPEEEPYSPPTALYSSVRRSTVRRVLSPPAVVCLRRDRGNSLCPRSRCPGSSPGVVSAQQYGLTDHAGDAGGPADIVSAGAADICGRDPAAGTGVVDHPPARSAGAGFGS